MFSKSENAILCKKKKDKAVTTTSEDTAFLGTISLAHHMRFEEENLHDESAVAIRHLSSTSEKAISH